jgi:large subunit ribosomal protein L25
MKTIEIAVKKRIAVGKTETKKLRNADNVPCVMYGGDHVYHFYAHENAFLKLVYTHRAHLVDLNIEGEKHVAIMQDIQFHPTTDKIIHIDFVEVFEDKPVIMHIPIDLTGSSIGVKNGGKVRQKRRSLKVKGLAKDLPDHLEVDMTMVDIGHVVKVGDLEYPNLDLLDPHRSMVVSVISSRLAAKGMEMPEEAVVAAEAEVPAEGVEAPAEETTDKKSSDKKEK